MAQHDYNIADQPGVSFLSDLNNALAAIVSQNAGTTAPSPTYAHQLWADTTSGKLKMRNAANNAWVDIGTLGSANLGMLVATAAASALAGLTPDADKLPYFTGASSAALATLTNFARTLIGSADASTALSNLGVSNFIKTLLDDSNAATARTTLGATSVGSALFTAVDANAARAAIGLPDGLGYGQTWQDVTASRASGTTYYNTTNKPIVVYLSGIWTNGTVVIGSLALTIYTTQNAGETFIVPPGVSYSVTGWTGTTSSVKWMELR
jgi:hypothetical protein